MLLWFGHGCYGDRIVGKKTKNRPQTALVSVQAPSFKTGALWEELGLGNEHSSSNFPSEIANLVFLNVPT